MMTRKTIVAMGILLMLGSGNWLHARTFDSDQFDQVVREGMTHWQVPGLAVSVVEDGEVVFKRGYGRTAADGEPVNEHTLFANASTTKAMVAAGLLILADEGKLSLDDPVTEHLPELHFHLTIPTRQITIRDLLAHRTGLPSTDFWTFRQLTPLDVQVRKLRLVEPAAAPRERMIYQNTMYELAGMIIERVGGQPWYRFLDERLWQPIGMLDTVGVRADIPGERSHVIPHAEVDGKVRPVPFDIPPDREDAAGSAWSSIHDMSLWAQFLLRGGVTEDGKRLLSIDSMASMFEPAQLVARDDFYPTHELTSPNWRSYALGWFQQDFQGRAIDFHTGSLDGLVAIIGLDRAAGRAVVVLQNMDGSELRHALLWKVMDTGDTPHNWLQAVADLYSDRADENDSQWQEIAAGRLANTSTSLGIDAYLGEYANDVLGNIFVERHGSDLKLRTGMYEYDVTHWHFDTFLVNYLTWSYGQFATFTVGPGGSIESLAVFGKEFVKVTE